MFSREKAEAKISLKFQEMSLYNKSGIWVGRRTNLWILKYPGISTEMSEASTVFRPMILEIENLRKKSWLSYISWKINITTKTDSSSLTFQCHRHSGRVYLSVT
jgi:hypothetical protein